MKIGADDPSRAIKVIEALADKTRRRMLLYLQQNPRGVTASQIATFVHKKIPTVLHHLQIFEGLGLVYNQMVDIAGSSKVKHWFLVDSFLNIELDLSRVAFMPNKYIIELFNNRRLKRNFIRSFLPEDSKIDVELTKLFPELTIDQITIIVHSLKKDFLHYLHEWIDLLYIKEIDSGKTLILDGQEFQEFFCLDLDLTQKMINRLLSSGGYVMTLNYDGLGEVQKSGIMMTMEYYTQKKKWIEFSYQD